MGQDIERRNARRSHGDWRGLARSLVSLARLRGDPALPQDAPDPDADDEAGAIANASGTESEADAESEDEDEEGGE